MGPRNCTLVLPHFDDEYCGCRSIVESDKWQITDVIYITDSTTQFKPQARPSLYYEMRLEESMMYLNSHNQHPKLTTFSFPEQLWDKGRVLSELNWQLVRLGLKGWVFAPYFNDAHPDHREVGRLFLQGNIASSVIYYKVHELADRGDRPPMPYIDAQLEVDYGRNGAVITEGKDWDPEEFRQLYMSQEHQIPDLGKEQYLYTELIEF